jgi:hypothetical protein
MDILEKGAILVDEVGAGLAESGQGRRQANKPQSQNSPARQNRLPVYRGARALSQGDARRFMSERSRALQSFIDPLEARVKRAFKYRARKYRVTATAQAKVAALVIEVIRELAHRETGVFNLEAPVPQLLSALFAGSVEAGIVTGLVRRAQKALALRDALERESARRGDTANLSARGLAYDVGRELDELTMLLKWYVRRKMSLTALEIDFVASGAAAHDEGQWLADERDALFGLEVMHDHLVFGTKGFLLSTGLKLIGRDGQALWLRVSLRSNGAPVAARPEWSSWTDPGDGAAIELLPEHTTFCSLVPIRPNSQRLVIDEIRAFVPYAALRLAAGRCDVEVVVAVIDGEGNELATAVVPESICVPPRELALAAVPAPHSLGMWPHDVVSGDKISEFIVSSGFKAVAGWERHSISAQFDLSLFMHAGESVTLECRFVDERGEIVELSSLGIPFVASEMNVAVESVSSYRYRRVLHPKGAWAFYQGLCVDIPVEFLLLTPGTHNITCELVIVSADDRVLCGDMSRIEVRVPNREARDDQEAQLESNREGLGVAGAVELESVVIDPAWSFGGDESIRVRAMFRPRDAAARLAELAAGRVGEMFAPYRVEVSLEREDGHVLLQAFSDALGMSFKTVTRAVCVEGHSGALEHTVVANFRKEEVLGWSLGAEAGRSGAKLRLFARVTAFTLTGEVVATEHREFFVKPLVSGGKRVAQIKEPLPTLVDLEAYANQRNGTLTAKAIVNLPSSEYGDEGTLVVCAVRKANGDRVEIGSKEVTEQQSGLWTKQVSGLTQCAVEFERRLEALGVELPIEVEFELISGNQERLELVQQRLEVEGGITEEQETILDQGYPESDPQETRQQIEGDPLSHKKSGLFGRLLGRKGS